MRRTTTIAAILFCARLVAGAELFMATPTVEKTKGGFEIAFALARATDLTVRILNANGATVRHLACGMVGLEKAAKPFQPRSLAQRIAWDGKDDAGQPVDPADSRAWLGAGMGAAFDRFILGERDGIGLGPRDKLETAVVPGLDGELLVTQNWGVHMNTTRVFNSEGRFIRCLWPFSLNHPRETVEPFLAGKDGVDDWDGRRVPLCVNHNAFYYFGTRCVSAAVTTDGFLVGSHGYVMGYTSLIATTREGFPVRKDWKPPWHTTRDWNRKKWQVAAGRDGDFFLADGIHHVVARFRARDFAPIPFTWSGTRKLAQPRPYIGEVDDPGYDKGRFQGPLGVAIDGKGNLLVTDRDAVKVYEPTGRFIERREKPDKPAARVPEAIAAATRNPRALTFPHFLRIDAAGRLYLNNYARDKPFVVSDTEGKAFTTRKLPWGHTPAQGYTAVDAEDNWYISVHPHDREKPDEVWKFSPDGKRLKIGEKDALPIDYGPRAEIKGLFVTRTGDIHVVAAVSKWRTPEPFKKLYGRMDLQGDEYNLTRVDVLGPDGKLKHKGLVRSQGINDVAVDREGNVYVLESTMWHGAHMMKIAQIDYHKKWPKVFPHLSPEQQKTGKDQASRRFSLMSRVLKFAPTGGVLDGQGGPAQLWGHAGVSGLSPWNCGAECPAGQMCLDPDQRLWVPDTFLYNVKALDTAGNPILRVGTYGNEDCTGGGKDRVLEGTRIVVDPEIPLARPSGMAVHGDHLFISDMYAHRVVRCRLTYRDVRQAPIPR